MTTFADVPGDGFHSDGAPYVTIRKRQELTSEITPDGRHAVTVNSGPAGRTLCLTFPPAGPGADIVSPSDWNDLVARSSGAVDLGLTYCGAMGFHTRDHSRPDELLGMDSDPDSPDLDVQTSGGKIPLQELDLDQSWEFRLFFDDGGRAGGSDENGVCIRYDADGTWTVGTDPAIAAGSDDPAACDAVDADLDLIRVTVVDGAAVYTHVATFRMPFTYTITPE